MVVNRHCQSSLGRFLADHVIVQIGFDFGWCRQFCRGVARWRCSGQFIANDFIAQFNALVTDKDRGSGNQFLDLMLTLAAKGAVKSFFAGSTFFFSHMNYARFEMTLSIRPYSLHSSADM